ncbi:MAG: O-antigen ligase/tetratricopeptide (TPR) repeat protein [Planctomycetota bacterium]|jgi:O-antigen ligase/tetratricopeptide (TPR) repeat protein
MKKLCQITFLATLFCVPLAHSRAIFDQTELPKRILVSTLTWILAMTWVFVRPKGLDAKVLKLPIIFGLGAGILVWQLAIWPFAIEPSQSTGTILMTLESLVWLWVSFELLSTQGLRRFALLTLAASGFMASIYGLMQYEELFPTAFPGGVVDLANWFGQQIAQTGLWQVPTQSLGQTDPPGSFFGHTNIAAEFVVLGFAGISVLSWATFWRSLRDQSWKAFLQAALGLTAASVLGLFILRSGSRSAMAAAMIAFLTAWFHIFIHDWIHRPLWGRRVLHVACHVGLVAVLAGSAILVMSQIHGSPRSGQEQVTLLERFKSSFDFDETTVKERRVLWGNTTAMAQENPVLGVGPGNFKIAYPEFASANKKHAQGRLTLRRQPNRPHNEYINFLAENGTFGAALLLMVFLSFLVPFMRRRNAFQAAADHEDGVALAAMCTIVAFLVMALFGFPWEQTAARLSFLVVLSLGIHFGIEGVKTKGWSGPRGLTWVTIFGFIFIASLAHYRASYQASKSMMNPVLPAAQSGNLDLGLMRLRAADQSVRRVPASADYHLRRGNLCRGLGLIEEAEASFQEALNRAPSLANAWLGIAWARQQSQRPQAAKIAVEKALALQPDEPQILISAGQIHEATGDRNAAIMALKKAVALAPDGEDRLSALLALSRIHSVIGNKPTSAYFLSQAEAMDNTHPSVLERKAYFLERHQPKSNACFAAWEAYVAVNPSHAEAHLRVCENFLQRGGYQEALAASARAIGADSALLIALFRRAQAQVGLELLQDARDTLFECMKRSSRPGAKDMSLYYRCRKLIEQIEARARKEGLMKKVSPVK